MTPEDEAKTEAVANALVKKGIHPSLAKQVAADLRIFHPEGGNLRVKNGVIQIIPKEHRLL